MIKLVFQHGWGFDPTFWQPLTNELPDYNCLLWNEGYFGQEDHALNKEDTLIGIGHSFGFSKLLTHQHIKWDGLVSIGGFTQFDQSDKTTIALKNIVKTFKKDPVVVLKSFYKSCSVRQHPSLKKINTDKLLEDLEHLLILDVSENFQITEIPVIALHAEDDAIVPCSQSENDFKGHLFIKHSVGAHGLGYNEVSWCAQHIKAFLQSHVT